MINKITVENELPSMSVGQLRDLQDAINYGIQEAFQKQDNQELTYLQRLDLIVAQKIDCLEFGD